MDFKQQISNSISNAIKAVQPKAKQADMVAKAYADSITNKANEYAGPRQYETNASSPSYQGEMISSQEANKRRSDQLLRSIFKTIIYNPEEGGWLPQSYGKFKKAREEEAKIASGELPTPANIMDMPMNKYSTNMALAMTGSDIGVADDIAKGLSKSMLGAMETNVGKEASVMDNLLSGIGKKPLPEAIDIHPNINLKQDVPITDIHGKKSIIPAGEALTPYELTGNKYLLKDGEEYIVNKNQYQNIKGNALSAEAKPFAPELIGTEETVMGGNKWNGDSLVNNGIPVADVYEQNGKWHYRSDMVDESPAFKTRKEAMDNAEADATGIYSEYGTKYSKYTLPGGDNYKEILIKASPNSLSTNEVKEFQALKDKHATQSLTDEELRRVAGLQSRLNDNNYRSSHWGDPNVLAHLRMNERNYKGKKVAFMEELQSDWAREWRKSSIEKPKKFGDWQDDQIENSLPAGADGYQKYIEQFNKFPNHPLLKNWQEPTIKRALKEAVDNDAEYFSWINGAQTSERYNLATYVDNVRWNKSMPWEVQGKNIAIKAKQGQDLTISVDNNGIIQSGNNQGEQWVGKKLDEVLGKGLADKIMGKESGTLSGEGLKFGGEWADNLYDKQVGDIVRKVTGGKIEVVDMGIPMGKGADFTTEGGSRLDNKWNKPYKGQVIQQGYSETQNNYGDMFVVTEVLKDGKFKATPKVLWDNINSYKIIDDGETFILANDNTGLREPFYNKKDAEEALKNAINKPLESEIFDISTPTSKQQAIRLTPEIKAKIRGEAPKIKAPSGTNPIGASIASALKKYTK